jgi:hypothetical protein
MDALYIAVATSTPTLGGDGKGTNPEQVFAATKRHDSPP